MRAVPGPRGRAAIAHYASSYVGRRRHETGLLKAIGFVNRQVAAAVFCQATTVALIGIVIGIPLGLVTGRAVWDAFALNIGVVPFAVVDAGLLVIIVLCVLASTALLALGPAIAAAHARPAQLLRAE